MEFAILAAGINAQRQCVQQGMIEGATGECGIQVLGVHAAQMRAQAAVDHLLRQCAGIAAEQGEQRLPAQCVVLLFAPAADVLQQQVAEGHRLQLGPALPCFVQGGGHALQVHGVVAGLRNPRLQQWQASGVRLGVQHVCAHALHRRALMAFGEGGKQRDHVHIVALLQLVQGPGGVFAAAPGQKDRGTHGASADVAQFPVVAGQQAQALFEDVAR
ncbi:hypothetical protein D3C71_1059900 [compost metagenome]